jgi:hypothetical protein
VEDEMTCSACPLGADIEVVERGILARQASDELVTEDSSGVDLVNRDDEVRYFEWTGQVDGDV